MSYVSLYRKYRSQTFAEVVGQDHVTKTLAGAVDDRRWHHAYLFTGPRGTGKTSTARILAKSLNCEAGPTSAPDDTCPQCVGIREGSSVDVIEIDAASHGGVDDVRELRDRVAFAPVAARLKVYIVDECHMLSTAGWNAFLKTVEEPPGHVVFVFATTEPHKVLPTILSRTQRFDFRRIPADLLADHCRAIAAREGFELEAGALDLVVRAGDGSARDTLSVLDQVVAFTGAHVTLAGVAEVLGAVPDELLIEAADLIADGDVAGLLVLVQRLADGGIDARQFARDCVEHLRSLLLLQVAPDAGLVETTPERLALLSAQSGRLGRIELLRAVDLLATAQAEMRRGNTRLPLEVALAKAALPEASGDPAALAARIDRLERRTGVETPATAVPVVAAPKPAAAAVPAAAAPGPAPTAAVAPPVVPAAAAPGPVATAAVAPAPTAAATPSVSSVAPPAATPDEPPPAPAPAPRAKAETARLDTAPVDLDLVRASWPAVLDALKARRKRVLRSQLTEGHPVALEDGVLVVEFPAAYSWHAEEIAREDHRDLFSEILAELFGARLVVRAAVSDGSAAAGQAAAPTPEEEVEARLRAQAVDVAETEEATAAGELRDDAAAHDLAVATLQRDLGATVVGE